MFMAFVYWQLSVGWHINTGLSFVLTVFVLAPLLGAVVERAVIQWMDPRNVATTLAVTVGLTLLFFGLVNNYIWQPTARVVPQFFGFSGFTFLGVHIDWEEVDHGRRRRRHRRGPAPVPLPDPDRHRDAWRGGQPQPLIGLFGGRPARLSTLELVHRCLAGLGGRHPGRPAPAAAAAHPHPARHRRLRGRRHRPPAQPAHDLPRRR